MINLLPPQLRSEKRINQIINQGIFAVVSLAILFGVWFSALIIYNRYLVNDLRAAEQKALEQKTKQTQFIQLRDKIEEANKKLDSIDKVSKERIHWTQVLSLIGTSVSKNMQIKNLALSSETGIISLSGAATSRTDIAITKEKLESLPLFKNVTFQSSSYNSTTNDYNFSLTFELSRP
ncbi:MAG TPA: PilN domain-containing protein [bacterium]|nr:PilN domain-containing protein [bacterium]